MKLIRPLNKYSFYGRFDWLHWTHQPFPFFAGIFEEKEDLYTAACWVQPGGWSVAVVGPNKHHCGLLQTYGWMYCGGRAYCRPHNDTLVSIEIFDRPDRMALAVTSQSIRLYQVSGPDLPLWLQ